MDKNNLIARLPKAELHMHVEGSLEPEMMFALARRNRLSLPYPNVDAIRAAYRFSCVQDFLDVYYEGMQVLRMEEDYFDLARAYFERAAADNVAHAEIFFDPQAHTERGIPFRVVADGLLAGMRHAEAQHGVSSKLILCFLRHLSEEKAFETLRAAEPWLDRIVAVGQDSTELGNPPAKFEKVFAAAASMGLKRVAHFGEEGPPEYVRGALDLLGIDRLDHGNRSLEDAELTTHLARRGMTLTVCPLSNICLQVVDKADNHPIGDMLEMGLRVTIDSDNPAYFGGYINDNFRAVAHLLSKEQIVSLARNSFLGSFLTDAEVARHLGNIDAHLKGSSLAAVA